MAFYLTLCVISLKELSWAHTVRSREEVEELTKLDLSNMGEVPRVDGEVTAGSKEILEPGEESGW